MVSPVLYNGFRQDPRVSPPSKQQIPAADAGERLCDDRFALADDGLTAYPDKDGNYLYQPSQKQFEQVQSYATAHKTADMLQDYAGHKIEWAFEGKQLGVAPHAGEGVNAYYLRWQECVCFYYFDAPPLQKTVQTAQSTDVVAHETGHALLDGLKPAYGQTFDNETRAFHEAFGDCTAMLYAASDPENCADALREGLDKDNCISRIAEEFGTAVRRMHHEPDLPYLRNERNDFRYVAPETLPADGPRETLSREPHSFCQVFAGAFYQCLVNLAGLSQDLQGAARTLGQIFTLGVEMASPARARYQDVAQSMLAADRALFQGAHQEALRQAFLARGIELAPEELPDLKLEPDFLARHGTELGVKPAEWTPCMETHDARGNTVLEFLAHEPLSRGPMDVYGGLSLSFDASGKLVHKSFDPVTPEAVAAERLGASEGRLFEFRPGMPAQARMVGGRLEKLPVFVD